MVKVGDMLFTVPLQPKKETEKTSKKGIFGKSLSKTPSASGAESSLAPQKMSSLASLMQLQEVEEHDDSCSFYERGEGLLTHLEVLRQGLLMGAFSTQDLEAIKADLALKEKAISQSNASAVATKAHSESAQEILRQIEQRVHIELAKIEMSL